VINEIMFNPLPMEGTNSVILEYIELRNTSSEDAPLFDTETPENTWRLSGGVQYIFPAGAVIPAGGYALAVSFDPATEADRVTAFRSRYGLGTDVQMFGPYMGRLENVGERVILLKAGSPKEPPDPDAGVVPYVAVDQVDYSNAAPWPIGADGTGESLQRIVSAAYGNDPVNWQVAPPTPASANAGSSVGDADGDGMPDDWEQVIVDFDPADATDSVLEVQRNDDFDKDGASNFAEYLAGCSPVDRDSDDDGYTDGDELTNSQSDPLSGSSTPPDNDTDFVSDVNDPDDDNDGYSDDDELTSSQSDPLDADSTPPDNDGDKVSDLNDPDDDNDGVPDISDAFPTDPTESVDTDEDGIGDNSDPDDDNDGYSDDDELTQSQSDPLDAESTPPDNDADYLSDLNDPDDDNDGVPDISDIFPFDPSESADADGDGIGDNADPDDDNDGYSDVDELTENQSDPLDDASLPPDNDADHVSDLNDSDDDNDGMPDTWEEDNGLDSFADDAGEDKDKDGQCNLDEWVAGTDPADPLSLLAVSAVVAGSDSTMLIRWQSVTGKFYSILRSSNLSAGFDQIEAANLPATPPENSYTVDTNGAQSFFYRVVVDR
ncbi:MAG: lamin tail domain-containing protein, partial [bacterium]|nr:lamin tail domain-containing protein [bacterium]